MKQFWRRNVHTVFIMQGNSCNMNCAYCLQHPLVHEPLSKDINPEIYDFLAQLAEENESGRIHLQFYGGEPLIYFPVMKKIIEETRKRKISCTYSTISNGRALTDEMVDFLNDHEIPVTISWDGYHTKDTRRFDIFADETLKARILKLDRLGLSGVISSKAYPLEILEAFQNISDAYEAIHGYKVRVNLDEIFDTGIRNRWLLDVDYSRVSHDMHRLAMLYLSFRISGKSNPADYTKIAYMDGFFQQLRNFYAAGNGNWNAYTAACGNGLSVLNMDLEGNLYPCHNTSKSIGNMHTPFFIYLQRLLAGDATMMRRGKCLTCPAIACCKGGCKLVSERAREETYCRLKQAVITPVIHAFEAYGRQMAGDGHG